VVTFLDPRTLQVQGTVSTGGTNSSDAAVGPDGMLYVVNTADYVQDGSVTIINPQSMQVVATVGGFARGRGASPSTARGGRS
jgi:DNA-binding beta-propeller fold protein YncE